MTITIYDNNNYDQDTNPKKAMYNREALVDHNIRLSKKSFAREENSDDTISCSRKA